MKNPIIEKAIEAQQEQNYYLTEIHTNATFEETLAEMKHGKNAIKPNYYKIPESEVVELFERLGNDSTEYLSTSQIINLSHCIKYLLRAPYKGKLEDLQKAKFFLDRILEGG